MHLVTPRTAVGELARGHAHPRVPVDLAGLVLRSVHEGTSVPGRVEVSMLEVFFIPDRVLD